MQTRKCPHCGDVHFVGRNPIRIKVFNIHLTTCTKSARDLLEREVTIRRREEEAAR